MPCGHEVDISLKAYQLFLLKMLLFCSIICPLLFAVNTDLGLGFSLSRNLEII